MIKKLAVDVYLSLKDFFFFKNARENKTFKKDLLAANIFRLVHSIEKGLSIEKPRLGFGLSKMHLILNWIEQLKMYSCEHLCIKAANDAFLEYFEYHDRFSFTSDEYNNVRKRASLILELKEGPGKSGGTSFLRKNELDFESLQIERFFKTRHSIRQFSKTKVDIKVLKKAIALAQTAPSACNRQAVRAYVIDPRKYVADIGASLEGIGGFADDVSYFILITGKLSAYDEFEYKQFIVSASFFAAYLSLTLHAYKLGSCVVQRTIRTTNQWIDFCKKNQIPQDEQVVVMLGVGELKDETIVPISKRYDVDDIMRIL